MWIDGIDEKDNQIVALLRENGRMSYSDIGEKVGLSRTAVKNRVSALEKAGIISGYHAFVKLQDAPQAMTFVVNIETEPGHFEEVRETLTKEEQPTALPRQWGQRGTQNRHESGRVKARPYGERGSAEGLFHRKSVTGLSSGVATTDHPRAKMLPGAAGIRWIPPSFALQ